MIRYQLAVASRDKEYTRRLAEYIRGSAFGEQWQVAAFTHPNACKQYVKQGYTIDLLAAEPELLRELQPELSHVPSVALVDKLGENGSQAELLQFQPLPLLLKGLSELFGKLQASSGELAGMKAGALGAKVATIHSASGGVGKTTLALHMASAAGTRGKKVFYLNLERWNTSYLWLETKPDAESAGDGMSELLYEVKNGTKSLGQWVAERRTYHARLKFDYLAGFRNAEDRLSLNAEDAVAIVDAVAGNGQYDIVIVDMDEGLGDMHVAVLNRANLNFWVVTHDPPAAAKQSMLLRYGLDRWGEVFQAIQSHSITIGNRSNESGRKAMNRGNGMPVAVHLPEVKEWTRGELHPILSSPVYRAAVDRLFGLAFGESEALHGVG
ncbi:hypothetical protein D3P08_12160 [Paenibacillus nanensis]|uniref:CobQ/CobB/MinD/ParA nucleotide binding domain-containing protein n=1 Tax=Paenibacillus nanensis TaxID=393251 RepID=A0A3A1UW60_9BACL|nr:AAA family ATPase [Paenibacillus nanensis]RIX52758.1 hypothetical protein D3P08_12160 [Paenibacillus nanensis]